MGTLPLFYVTLLWMKRQAYIGEHGGIRTPDQRITFDLSESN